jgi:YD repeat-containing protein
MQLSTLVYKNSSSATLLDLTYGYGTNSNGQIQTVTDASGADKSLTYTYDWLGRLSRATTNNLSNSGTYCLDFGYDRYGNRLSQTGCASGAGTLSAAATDPDCQRHH